MTLTQLRYLVAIVDAGLNITQAAAAVHATQPGISKQLKALEDGLGFLLFQRKGRSLTGLTEAGAVVLEHARRVLAEAHNIRNYAADRRGEPTGTLHLATTHTQARFVLPSAIAQLSRRYPNVSVRLETLADGDVLPQLARGTVDMAILSTTGAAPSGGHAVPLYRWHRVVLVPSHHPLALLERAPTLAELVRHPLLTYQSFNHPESSLRRALQAQNLAPNVAMSAPDADLIKTYVRAGLGVGIVAEMAVHPVQDADLRVLPAPDVLPTCITWAVVPRERVLRQFVTDCIRLLAPDLDAHDLRRVLAGHQEPRWPDPPQYAVRRLAPLRGELPRSFV